jgi:hypothetical protein
LDFDEAHGDDEDDDRGNNESDDTFIDIECGHYYLQEAILTMMKTITADRDDNDDKDE